MRRVLLLVVALFAVGCAREEAPKEEAEEAPQQTFAAGSYMAQIKERGKLRAGVKIDIPQFGLLNPTTNKHEGFDIDMATEIAKAIGVEPEFTEAISKNRIPYLQQDTVDIIFSTMTITAERRQQIDFSDVYYVAGQTFLTRKGTKISPETAAGKKVCSAKGSTSADALPKLQPKIEVVLLDAYAQCAELVRNQQADAVFTDDVILLQFVQKEPQSFEISAKTYTTEPYGAGIKKGRDDFVKFVNGVIGAMKKDGRWARIYGKWIKPVTGRSADPPPVDVSFAGVGATPAPAGGTAPARGTPAPTYGATPVP